MKVRKQKREKYEVRHVTSPHKMNISLELSSFLDSVAHKSRFFKRQLKYYQSLSTSILSTLASDARCTQKARVTREFSAYNKAEDAIRADSGFSCNHTSPSISAERQKLNLQFGTLNNIEEFTFYLYEFLTRFYISLCARFLGAISVCLMRLSKPKITQRDDLFPSSRHAAFIMM